MIDELPEKWVILPEEIVNLLVRIPGVCVNLRPVQWTVPAAWVNNNGNLVYSTVRDFLKKISAPLKVVILFQGDGEEIITAVVELSKITRWAVGDYPKLDFTRPAEMSKMFSCPEFWGAYILAIAKMPAEMETFAIKDPTLQTFMNLVTLAIP